MERRKFMQLILGGLGLAALSPLLSMQAKLLPLQQSPN